MALGRKRRVVSNPAGMSEKQIRFFGTAAQRAALKRRKQRRRNAGAGKRRHTIHKPATRPRRRVKQFNPGAEILSLVANPASKKRRKRTMAKAKRRAASSGSHKRRRTRRAAAAPTTHRRRRRQTNPSAGAFRRRHRRRGSTVSHRRRRRMSNPSGGGGGLMGLFTNTLWSIGGAVGTRVITQAVLGDSNTGVMGYIGNAVTAFGLSLVVGKLMRNPSAGKAVLAGGAIAIVLRLISDYTPLGKYTSQIGLGDYQVSNWVTPQRYTDALNSAQVEVPAGWAPTVVATAAPPGGGVAGLGGGLYSSSGLYS